jgi:hypothetical protein
MKSLKKLKLDKHKTSNFADYCDSGLICCGLMDVHEDSENLGENNNPIFSLEPLYWDKKAVFVCNKKKKWHSLSKADFLKKKKVPGIKYVKNGFSFNAEKYHGLVPQKVAKKLNDKKYTSSKEYKKFNESCSNMMKPMLVWKWIK